MERTRPSPARPGRRSWQAVTPRLGVLAAALVLCATPVACGRARAETATQHVAVSEAAFRTAGVELAPVGPAEIRDWLPLWGRIVADPMQVARVTPRFAGVVRTVGKRIGDRVERGDVLAVIESNQSLSPYTVRAGIDGVVVESHVTAGEFVSGQEPLFVLADLDPVWAELDVHRPDLRHVRVGQRARVAPPSGDPPVEAAVSYLAPIGEAHTQTVRARVVLPNRDGSWRPGLFVRAELELGTARVATAVPTAALQRLDGRNVVFVRTERGFDVRPVETGRDDGRFVEVLSGLREGEEVAATQSFVLKSELLKDLAEGGH